jgi:hypothetical protein
VTRLVRSFSPELGTGNYINKYAWKISSQFVKEAAKFTGIHVKNVINIPIMKACHNRESNKENNNNNYINCHFLIKISNCFDLIRLSSGGCLPNTCSSRSLR